MHFTDTRFILAALLTKNISMKPLFIIASLLLLSLFSFSQTQKGAWMLGASVGSGTFSHTDSKDKNNSYTNQDNDTKTFAVALSPSALYFVSDNVALGAAISFGYSSNNNTQTYPSSGTQSSKSKAHYFPVSFDPEIRKYFGKPGSKGLPWVNIFGGVNTMPGKGTVEVIYNNEPFNGKGKYTSYGWNAGAGIGYAHFFNEHIALQYFINFRHTWLRNTGNFNTPLLAMPVNYTNSNDINFGVGLQIHLSKKTK